MHWSWWLVIVPGSIAIINFVIGANKKNESSILNFGIAGIFIYITLALMIGVSIYHIINNNNSNEDGIPTPVCIEKKLNNDKWTCSKWNIKE